MDLPGFVLQYECHIRNPLYVVIFEEFGDEYREYYGNASRYFNLYLFICDGITWYYLIDMLRNSTQLNVWNYIQTRSEGIAGVGMVNVEHEGDDGLEKAIYEAMISEYPNFSMDSREIPIRMLQINSRHRFTRDIDRLVNSRRMS